MSGGLSEARGDQLSNLLENPQFRIFAIPLLAVIVLSVVGLGSDLRVTSPKGCEVSSWARNLARGDGFFSGVYWLGEVTGNSGETGTSGHYPPLPAVVHSVVLKLFGDGAFQVLLPSILVFALLPVWILRMDPDAGVSAPTLILTAFVVLLFPPLLEAAFQPDGEILLAALGAVALAGIFLARSSMDHLWVGLIASAAILVSWDAVALYAAAIFAIVFKRRAAGGLAPGWLLGGLLIGALPGLIGLSIYTLYWIPEGSSIGDFWKGVWLLGTHPVSGYPRALAGPWDWRPPTLPGGWIRQTLDGLEFHSAAALASAPIWSWGLLAVGILAGKRAMRRQIGIILFAWSFLWVWRAIRLSEETAAFTLFSVWLILLSIETLFGILNALVKFERITPGMKLAALYTLLLVSWWPGFFEIRELRRQLSPEHVRLENLWAERIQEVTDPNSLLLSDTPERLAWMTDRQTSWLPESPELLPAVDAGDREVAVVLSGAIENTPDVDERWWELFEAGAGGGGFTEVFLDPETYCQVWKKPGE